MDKETGYIIGTGNKSLHGSTDLNFENVTKKVFDLLRNLKEGFLYFD